jgi:hypothetical protein
MNEDGENWGDPYAMEDDAAALEDDMIDMMAFCSCMPTVMAHSSDGARAGSLTDSVPAADSEVTPFPGMRSEPGQLSTKTVDGPSTDQFFPLMTTDGGLYRPSVLTSRSGGVGSVEGRFRAIIGANVRQSELISIRQGSLFKDILPKLTRGEKRTKTLNLATFESCRAKVLEVLECPGAIAEVVRVALEGRAKVLEKQALLMHVFGLA